MKPLKPYSRRNFLMQSAVGFTAMAALPGFSKQTGDAAGESSGRSDELTVSIFSKHLQFLDHRQTGEMAAELGFSGVDLTVRPNGHILPEQVETDLPKAITDITTAGSRCRMITTAIENAANPRDAAVIKAAAAAGVAYYRTNWYTYSRERTFAEDLEAYAAQIKGLGELNRKHGIVGCYQNHAGTKVGGSFWEIKKLLETVDPAWFGVQYDIRHAVAEGGFSWPNGLKLLQPHIKVIVLKDFKWGKVNGKRPRMRRIHFV